jgi:hypothetical protein
MPLPPPWRALEVMVDNIVDGQWGEPVELHPMAGADIDSEAGPDPTRPIIRTTGIFVTPGAAAMGEGGTVASGMATRVVQNDTWLSISDHNLKRSRLHEWKEEDRVYFPDRDQWYKVLYPTPSATARPQIYLARVQIEQP